MRKAILLILIFTNTIFSQISEENNTNNDTIKKLEEIILEKNRRKAGVYRLILPKAILENETLDKTILRTSFFTIDNSYEIYFKGKKINSFYLNDKRISIEEFKKLNLENTKSIDIESNNFNQSTGELEVSLKIKDKANSENNIKGSIDAGYGILQEFNHSSINLNLKNNNFYSNIYIGNLINQTDNEIIQNYNDMFEFSKSKRTIQQPYFSLKNIYSINDKSSISIKNTYSIQEEKFESNFSNLDKINYTSKNNRYKLNLMYDLKSKSSDIDFKLNFDYLNYNMLSKSILNTDNTLESKSIFNEVSLSPLLTKKWGKSELANALLVTIRKYDFKNTNSNNKQKQEIYTHFIKYSYTFNNNNSTIIGNRYQIEKNDITKKTNHYLLPFITHYTKIDSIIEMEFTFKRKAIRPYITSISNSTYLDENGNTILNPIFLETQIDNSFSINFSRPIKKINFSLNLAYDYNKNKITNKYDYQNNILTNRSINVNSYQNKSITSSFAIPLFKQESSLNLNYTLSHLNFKNDDDEFSGYINQLNFSLSGLLLKKYFYSVNSFYTNRFYASNYFYTAQPDFSIMLSRDFFKNKLNVFLEYRSILNKDSNRKLNYNQNINNYNLDAKNQSNLILITLSYNFGKKFKMARKNIQNINDDIKEK